MKLKWLSVVQNKLRSLKGIEGLSNLAVSSIKLFSSVKFHLFLFSNSSRFLLVSQVLNAGKNMLRSMDEVSSLVSLRALILNGELCITVILLLL